MIFAVPPPPVHRPSKLDAFAEQIETWVAKYEDLTAVRLHEKLTVHAIVGGVLVLAGTLLVTVWEGRNSSATPPLAPPPGSVLSEEAL